MMFFGLHQMNSFYFDCTLPYQKHGNLAYGTICNHIGIICNPSGYCNNCKMVQNIRYNDSDDEDSGTYNEFDVLYKDKHIVFRSIFGDPYAYELYDVDAINKCIDCDIDVDKWLDDHSKLLRRIDAVNNMYVHNYGVKTYDNDGDITNKTMMKQDGKWYIGFTVLMEYLREIDEDLMFTVINDILYAKECELCEYYGV